jgi:anti-sigma factor RsiW
MKPTINQPFPPGPITSEMLSAFVDGELNATDLQRVQSWLQDHPEDQVRVAAWRADREALGELFKPTLSEPTPPELLATVWRRPSQPRWAIAAAAAGLLLTGALAGGGGVWQWQQQRHEVQLAQQRIQLAAGSAQGWVQRAAFAHSVYVAEPRHAVEVKAQEEHLSRWLTRRINIPVKLFDLQAQGFDLVGGRLLPDGPGKSAQLLYQDAQSRRVTVYLRRPEEGTQAAFRYEQQGKVGMFYWVEEGAGYALVGELPKETLLTLSQAIYAQMGAPLPATPASSATSPSAPTGLSPSTAAASGPR